MDALSSWVLAEPVPGGTPVSVGYEVWAERLAGALWLALSATLDPAEMRAVQLAVSARHTEELVTSAMCELGWLRDAQVELARFVDPGLPVERSWLRLPPDRTAGPYQLLWARSGVVGESPGIRWRLGLDNLTGVGGVGETVQLLVLGG